MNRRQFTASLGALTGAAALPIPAVPATASTLSPVAQSTYAWAKLIARAQSKADAAMLARHLKLTPETAQHLYQSLIHDGILRAPIASGVAQAADPLDGSGRLFRRSKTVQNRLKTVWETVQQESEPLAIEQNPALGCDTRTQKDCTDARTDEPLQESPQEG